MGNREDEGLSRGRVEAPGKDARWIPPRSGSQVGAKQLAVKEFWESRTGGTGEKECQTKPPALGSDLDKG